MPSPIRSTANWVAGHALPVVAGGVIVAAAAAGGGVSYALSSHSNASPAGPSQSAAAVARPAAKTTNPRRAAIEKLLTVVTTDTGQSLSSIEAQLAAGKTMNQVAGANATKLEDDVLAAVKAEIDKGVSAGRMTAADETSILTKARTFLDKAMTEPGPTLLQELQNIHQGKGHATVQAPAAPPSPSPTPAL